MDGAKDTTSNGDAGVNGKTRRSNGSFDNSQRGGKGQRSASRNSNPDDQENGYGGGYGRGDSYRGGRDYEQRRGGYHDGGYQGGGRGQAQGGGQRRRDPTPPASGGSAGNAPRPPPIGTERGEGKPSAAIAEAARIQGVIAPPSQQQLTPEIKAKVEQVQGVLAGAAPDISEILAVLHENRGEVQKTIDHFLESQKAGAPSAWSEVVKRTAHTEPARTHAPAAQQQTHRPQQAQAPHGAQPQQPRPAQPAPHAAHPHAAPQQHPVQGHPGHPPAFQQPHPPAHAAPPPPAPVEPEPEPVPEPEPEPVLPAKRPEEVASDLNSALTMRMALFEEQTRRLREIQQQLNHATQQGETQMGRLREEKMQLLESSRELQERLRKIQNRLSDLDIEIDQQDKERSDKIHSLNEEFRAAEAALLGGTAPAPIAAKPPAMPQNQLHALQQVVPHLQLQHPGQIGQGRRF